MMKRRFKNVLFDIAQYAAVGFVTTCIVVVLSATLNPVRYSDFQHMYLENANSTKCVHKYARLGADWLKWHDVPKVISTVPYLTYQDTFANTLSQYAQQLMPPSHEAFLNARGWPWRACYDLEGILNDRRVVVGGIPLNSELPLNNLTIAESNSTIPFMPLPGLFLDTFVFGLSAWFLLRVRSSVRRGFVIPTLVRMLTVFIAIMCLGTLSAVGIAWLFAYWGDAEFHPNEPRDLCGFTKYSVGSWFVGTSREAGVCEWNSNREGESYAYGSSGGEVTLSAEEVAPSWSVFLNELGDRTILASGWPFLCLWRGTINENNAQIQVNSIRVKEEDGAPALPTAIIPLGMLGDVAVWSGVWIVLASMIVGPGWIRGCLCPACAYPIGSSPVCTECGKPVNARSVEPT
jgi:hypothetical protein